MGAVAIRRAACDATATGAVDGGGSLRRHLAAVASVVAADSGAAVVVAENDTTASLRGGTFTKPVFGLVSVIFVLVVGVILVIDDEDRMEWGYLVRY